MMLVLVKFKLIFKFKNCTALSENLPWIKKLDYSSWKFLVKTWGIRKYIKAASDNITNLL